MVCLHFFVYLYAKIQGFTFFLVRIYMFMCVLVRVCVHLCVHVYVCTIMPGLVFSYLQIVSHDPGMSLLEEGRTVGAYVLLGQNEGAPS